MRRLIRFMVIIIISISSLTTKAVQDGIAVPYTEVTNYVLRVDYMKGDLRILKVDSEEKFFEIFQRTDLLGERNQSKEIDFSKNFVIALLYEPIPGEELIGVKSLIKKEQQIYLDYHFNAQATEGSGVGMRSKILLVDRVYDGGLYSYSTDDKGNIAMGSDFDQFGCKASAGTTWSVLMNDCIWPWLAPYVLEGIDSDKMKVAYLFFNEDQTKAEIMGSKYGRNIILERVGETEEWISGELKLIRQADDIFALMHEQKKVAIGRSRKLED